MEPDCHKFALVVPTLNEAANIEPLLNKVVAALSHSSLAWEILVVDDESSDGTPNIVKRFAHSEPRVRLLVRAGQRGLAGAITYGWAHTDADLLGVIDADLQHPPDLLPTLISKVADGSEIAIASRYVQPHSMEGWSPCQRPFPHHRRTDRDLLVAFGVLMKRSKPYFRHSLSPPGGTC